MKILIRVGCCFIYGAIIAALQMNGIYLGFVPVFLLFSLCLAIAEKICFFYDVKKFEREARSCGKTTLEYAKTKFSRGLLDLCEVNRHNKKTLKNVLKNSAKEGVISKSEVNVLFNMFYDKKQ